MQTCTNLDELCLALDSANVFDVDERLVNTDARLTVSNRSAKRFAGYLDSGTPRPATKRGDSTLAPHDH